MESKREGEGKRVREKEGEVGKSKGNKKSPWKGGGVRVAECFCVIRASQSKVILKERERKRKSLLFKPAVTCSSTNGGTLGM